MVDAKKPAWASKVGGLHCFIFNLTQAIVSVFCQDFVAVFFMYVVLYCALLAFV